MTRIGAITVKLQDGGAPVCWPIVVENGERLCAEFVFDRALALDLIEVLPGIYSPTHYRYRRSA